MAKRWIAASLLATAIAAAPNPETLSQILQKRQSGRLPGNDPFYAPPAGFESKPLGAILKSRSVPTAITITNISPVRVKKATQIQYRTQNSLGDPNASVVTVLEPFRAHHSKLLVFCWFSDSACPDCNPSLSLQTTRGVNNSFYKLQFAPVIAALNQGWIVSIADADGPQAAFPSGLQAAYGTLDSIRAVLQSKSITGVSRNPTITMTGYSGGGIAAAWTSELQPSYAPEIRISGVALGGLIPNFQYLTELVPTTQSLAYWVPPVIVGLSHDYPDLRVWLDENLVPAKRERFLQTEKLCLEDAATFYKDDKSDEYFVRGYESWNDTAPATALRSAGIMGTRGTPRIPWYLYSSVGDEISPIFLTQQLYDKYCSQGANIFYEENQLKQISHSLESSAGFSGAFTWLKERMAGLPARRGCQKAAVSRQTVFGFGDVLLSTVYDLYLALLGVPVNLASVASASLTAAAAPTPMITPLPADGPAEPPADAPAAAPPPPPPPPAPMVTPAPIDTPAAAPAAPAPPRRLRL